MTFYSHKLYSSQQSRELDQLVVRGTENTAAVDAYQLMQRAATAVYEFSNLKFPHAHSIVIITGAGNNAGDGYVYAELAMQNGCDVTVYSLLDPAQLTSTAEQAYNDWLQAGGRFSDDFEADLLNADLIIDAILGTGLNRALDEHWQATIQQVNYLDTPVISIDIPSGLNANTGCVMGASIEADYTVCLLALKKGLFTGQGRDYCGEIIFNDLQIDATIYQQITEEARLLSEDTVGRVIQPRRRSTHKGETGHLLLIGGNKGMCGAVILAAQAALRSGVGRVTVITRPEHVAAVVAVQPELMVLGLDEEPIPDALFQRVDCIAIGPGLGRDDWAATMFDQVIYQHHVKIFDADALYFLPQHAADLSDSVITPHPAEAARLLSITTDEVESDRFASVHRLFQEYNAISVLKGAGSLVYDGYQLVDVCPYGNEAMASAGMGDILTGIIASLIAQGYDKAEAVRVAVCLHSQAADDAATQGKIGLLAGDLLAHIYQRINL